VSSFYHARFCAFDIFDCSLCIMVYLSLSQIPDSLIFGPIRERRGYQVSGHWFVRTGDLLFVSRFWSVLLTSFFFLFLIAIWVLFSYFFSCFRLFPCIPIVLASLCCSLPMAPSVWPLALMLRWYTCYVLWLMFGYFFFCRVRCCLDCISVSPSSSGVCRLPMTYRFGGWFFHARW